jgi:sec-independent protein translocase protein TatA
MFGLGMPELIIILVVIILVFGAGRISEIGGAVGKGIRNFKKSINGLDEFDTIPPKNEKEHQK